MSQPTANFSHQLQLFNPRFARKCILVGAGSVGSWVRYFLAKLGAKDIEVWDADMVTSDNLPMSCYRPRDVARYKVEALKEFILENTGVSIKVRQEMYGGQPLSNAAVVSCVDRMAARETIWQRVRMHPTIHLFVDTRVRFNYLDVLTINPTEAKDIERYESLMFPDDEVLHREICGFHGVNYVSTRAANIAVSSLAAFWQQGITHWRVGERCDTLQRVH